MIIIEYEIEIFVGAGHARDCYFVRGQHPQEVRRGCKGLKPQQHTQGPLLREQDQMFLGHVLFIEAP